MSVETSDEKCSHLLKELYGSVTKTMYMKQKQVAIEIIASNYLCEITNTSNF